MNKVFTIAWREFKATAMTKTFFFVVLSPVLVMGIIGAVAALGFLAREPAVLEGRVAVADRTTGQFVVEGLRTAMTPESARESAAQQMEEAFDQHVGSANRFHFG